MSHFVDYKVQKEANKSPEFNVETVCLNHITEASKVESASNTKTVLIPKYMSTQASDRTHKMSLEKLKESNGDFLRQEVTAATNCRNAISIDSTERKDHLNEGK